MSESLRELLNRAESLRLKQVASLNQTDLYMPKAIKRASLQSKLGLIKTLSKQGSSSMKRLQEFLKQKKDSFE